MKTVQNGSKVQVHYKGTFTSGEVFDDSRVRGEPMQILIGEGRVLPPFETALVGMTPGETKSISLTAAEAYGEVRQEAIADVPRSAFPPDYVFEIGTRVQGNDPNGNVILAQIVGFNEETVKLDHNHPLAGRDINFDIELVDVEFGTAGSDTETLNKYTVKELRTMAKEKGIKGFSTMKKAELVESLSD